METEVVSDSDAEETKTEFIGVDGASGASGDASSATDSETEEESEESEEDSEGDESEDSLIDETNSDEESKGSLSNSGSDSVR